MSFVVSEPIDPKTFHPRMRRQSQKQMKPRISNTVRQKSQKSKRNPSIIIPKNAKTEVRSTRVASQGKYQPIDQYSSISNFPPPLTPQVQIVAELSPLIERCSAFMEYPIVPVIFDISPRPPNPAAERKRETLMNIKEIVSDRVLRNALSKRTYLDLIEMIKLHIFRPIPKFQAPDEFSEVSQFYIIRNWEHIEIVHTIFQFLMQDVEMIAPKLDDQFMLKLVQQLDSPVMDERILIEKDLTFILQHFVGYRQSILRHLLARVIGYLDGITYYTLSMASILRLFLDYFCSLPLPLKQNNFLLFRTVFYPLFATNFAYMFEEPLHQLSSFFQSLEPATSLWCLHYLKKHWPRASTTKQILFLHQFMRLLPTQPATVLESLGPLVLKIIAPCITSQNFKVSMISTSFVTDDDFIEVYKPLPDAISNILMPAAKTACDHWNQDERDLAICLMDKLSDFRFRSKPATRVLTATMGRNRIDNQQIGWNDIINLAASNDPALNADEYRNRLTDFVSKESENQCMTS